MAAFKEAFDAFDWNKSGNISYGSLQVNTEEEKGMRKKQEDKMLRTLKCSLPSYIQGVFFTGPPPRNSKYRLGVSRTS